MVSLNALARARHAPEHSVDKSHSHADSIQQRLNQPSFTIDWKNLPADEQNNVIKIVASALKDAKKNGVLAHMAARLLMGKSDAVSRAGNLQGYVPSPRTQHLMDRVLKTGSSEQPDKAADKLDCLLGTLLSKVPQHEQWHGYLFEHEHASALHLDLAKSNLSDATKESIDHFKIKQFSPASNFQKHSLGPPLHHNVATFHRTLYQAAFKGEPLPFAANAAFFPRYIVETLKTRPDKFNYLPRKANPADWTEAPIHGIQTMIEDAFLHLDPATPMRAELREALFSLQIPMSALKRQQRMLHGVGIPTADDVRDIRRDASLAIRDVAFHCGPSDGQTQLQQRLINRAEHECIERPQEEDPILLVAQLLNPSSIRLTGASASTDGAHADATILFHTALLRRIEILARPDRHESLQIARSVVAGYSRLFKLARPADLRLASFMEPAIYRLLAQNVIRDPDDLRQLGEHLRSGQMSLRGARSAIELHHLYFLPNYCAAQRIAMLPLLSKHDNLRALTQSELRSVLLQNELLIPASRPEIESQFGEQIKTEIGSQLRSPACAALLHPDLLQPVAEHIDAACVTLYGTGLPDGAARELIPKLAALGRHQEDKKIAALLEPLVDLPAGRAPATGHGALLKPQRLASVLSHHLASLVPEIIGYGGSAAAQILAHTYSTSTTADAAPPGAELIENVLIRNASRAVASALAAGTIAQVARGAVMDEVSRHPALARLENEQFRSSAAELVVSNVSQARKVVGMQALMSDREGQQFFSAMGATDKKMLAVALAQLDGPALMVGAVQHWMNVLCPLLAYVDGAAMRQIADKMLAHRDWPARVSAEAGRRNHFGAQIAEFEQCLRNAPAATDAHGSGLADAPEIWGALIERTLPFRNPGNLRDCLADKKSLIPANVIDKIDFANQYFNDIDADPDDPEETPLKAYVIGDASERRLLAVDELDYLNAHNVDDHQSQHFALRAPAPQGNGQWVEEAISPAMIGQADLPSFIRRALLVDRSSTSTFQEAIFAAFGAALGEAGPALSVREENSLRLCFQKMAADFRATLPTVVLDKAKLRENTGDIDLEVEFTALRSVLIKPAVPSTAMSLHELSTAMDNPTASLPAKLIAEMDRRPKLSALAHVLDTQAAALTTLCQTHAAKHEIYFLLALILLRLSSTDGLGYHKVNDNQSFVKFQLMGNYCLAKCLVESDSSGAGKGGLDKLDKKHVLEQLRVASTTGTCTGIISNGLAGYAPDHMAPLLDRMQAVLRFAGSAQ